MSYDPSNHQIRPSLGALELGGFVSVFLSGIVTMQVYLYYRVYPKDRRYLKSLVGAIWFLDSLHTSMGVVANWKYLIQHFGDELETDHINWSVSMTVALTAIVTTLVHCFFIHRIYIVSKGNKIFTLPLAFLALFRLVAASVTTAEMIRMKSFEGFVAKFGYVFTLGLALSVALDVCIMTGLSYYLRKSKSGFSTMNDVIDSLVLYTVETGLATCLTTIVSLVCWLAMPHNLIFLGLHFTISKLYANSFMATLNSRATLRARSQSSSDRDRDVSLPVFLSDMGRRGTRRTRQSHGRDLSGKAMQISVHKTIQHEVTGELTNVDLAHGGPSHVEMDDCSSESRSMQKTPPFTHSSNSL